MEEEQHSPELGEAMSVVEDPSTAAPINTNPQVETKITSSKSDDPKPSGSNETPPEPSDSNMTPPEPSSSNVSPAEVAGTDESQSDDKKAKKPKKPKDEKGEKKPKKKKPEGEGQEESTAEGEEKKRKRSVAVSIVCQLRNEAGEPACKQRAIVGYNFCIRHILNDPNSPYIQCEHTRRPKNKTEPPSRCTNAIKKDSGENFCSTHLIMAGLKEAKKKPVTGEGETEKTTDESQQSTSSQEGDRHRPQDMAPLHIAPPKIDSHLLRALSSPVGSSLPPMVLQQKPEQHSILRSVLEGKMDPGMIPQRFMVPVASKAPEAPPVTSAPTTSQMVKEEERNPRKMLHQRSRDDIRALVSGMNTECKKKFLGYLIRKRQRKQAEELKLPKPKEGGGYPKTIAPEQAQKLSDIWAKLDAVGRRRWTASVLSRGGHKLLKGNLPFTAQQLQNANPSLTKLMINARRAVPPTRLTFSKGAGKNLALGTPPIRFAEFSSSSDDDDDFIPQFERLRIRAKMQVRKMVGPYRDVTLINEMCNKIEREEFDEHHMLPIGYESSSDSEDEEGMVAPMRQIHPVGMKTSTEYKDKELQLYMLRKQLRLERHQLMRTAQVNAPIMSAVRKHPTATGAALRQQLDSETLPTGLMPSTIRRCCQIENKQRCERACLPSSNHCSHHVLYNVNQKLFQFCTHPVFCRRPVLTVDVALWDGKCTLHRDSRLEKYGPYPYYCDLREPSKSPSTDSDDTEDEDVRRRSSSSYERLPENEDDDDLDDDFDNVDGDVDDDLDEEMFYMNLMDEDEREDDGTP